MEITSATFETSMAVYAPPANPWPQIALAGRSNVGKSSLINCLCRRKQLAKVGATPGKTRLLNFYAVNGGFYIVDLPGYGYAEAGKGEAERWGMMMDHYFGRSEAVKAIIHIVDIRHEPTRDDLTMNTFIRSSGIPFIVVASKCDKISRGARMKYLAPIMRALQVQPWQVVCFSSENAQGRDELLIKLEELLNA